MPTLNTAVTSTWTKVVEGSDGDFLITWHNPTIVEFATTDTDVAPTINGHQLNYSESPTRAVLGDGYVWARLIAGSTPETLYLIVTK